MKLDVFKDKNEFNLNLKKRLGSFIEKSQFLECSELPMEEDLLEKKRPNIDYSGFLWSNVSSANSSNYNSPRFKLKVDELDERRDMEKKRKFVGEQENEIIEEEEKIDHEDRFSQFMKQCFIFLI